MKKMIAGSVAAALLLFGVAVSGPALAKAPPLAQRCSSASNGGTLQNGVCVLPGAIAGSASGYFWVVMANNNEAADTFTIVSGSLPPGLTMLSHYGVADTIIEGVATTPGTFGFTVKAADPDERLSVLQTYSIAITTPPPDVLLCSPDTNGGTLVNGVCVLPGAAVGQPYEGFIITSNNSGGAFSIIAGSLPPGLSLLGQFGASGAIVAGTPTLEGTFTFTVKGTDQEGQPLQQTYSIKVGPPLPLTETTPNPLHAGTVGTPYAANFFLFGGVAPYSWSLAAGQFPPGLGLISTDAPNDNNNQLAGTPTTAGTFVFTMRVTDGRGVTATGQVNITIDPRPPLEVSGTGVCCATGTVGTAYPYIAFGASGGQTPYTWSVASGQVPPGLVFSSGNPGTLINNVLSGTPTKAATFAFTMKVTDSLGDTATQSFSIAINL